MTAEENGCRHLASLHNNGCRFLDIYSSLYRPSRLREFCISWYRRAGRPFIILLRAIRPTTCILTQPLSRRRCVGAACNGRQVTEQQGPLENTPFPGGLQSASDSMAAADHAGVGRSVGCCCPQQLHACNALIRVGRLSSRRTGMLRRAQSSGDRLLRSAVLLPFFARMHSGVVVMTTILAVSAAAALFNCLSRLAACLFT